MKIRVFFAVLACKLSRFLIRLLGRGGTDLPGRVALKFYPDLLNVLAKGVTTILVTGTNGKTTTSRMIEQSLADSGISFFANRSGANLLSGVTAEFAAHSTLGGRCKFGYALIEADEAAFKHIARGVRASCVVVTNVFRDQLDRYGEVTHTLENIRLGLELCPDAVVCLNADDSLCTSLKDQIPNKVIFYGLNTPIYANRVEELSDAPYCVKCKHAYSYRYVTYGHLGSYECPACGFRRPDPDVFVEKILSLEDASATVVFSDGTREDVCVIGLPGGYNIYNACAAMAAGKAIGLDPAVTVKALGHFTCGFGRMERFAIGKTEIRMILIKNPAGCNQVLNFLSQLTEQYVFAICLNDRTQDGKDVSWIWDVDFECLYGPDKPL
ncbi:MAG: MurT ligase domain-containing protein, partial [Oscillospiraceae bacterium]|nr:MurT ligase domain-containing protein [Oscillospiraceae bacterium]